MKKKKENAKASRLRNKNIIYRKKNEEINSRKEANSNKIIDDYEREIENFIKINLEKKEFPWIFFKKMTILLLHELIKPHDYLIENSNLRENKRIENFIKDKCTLLIAIDLINNVYINKYDN